MTGGIRQICEILERGNIVGSKRGFLKVSRVTEVWELIFSAMKKSQFQFDEI